MVKQKNNTKNIHIRALHKRRICWFAVLLFGLVGIQFANNIHNGRAEILSHSTSITSESLLQETNKFRESDQLDNLRMNDALANAAQNKANDMVERGYWGHNTPEGLEPWAFIKEANYKYDSAGENLAYGFSASSEIVSAWIQSESHRKNLLGSYSEVGFGIAESSEFQGSANTIVVAFYGRPAKSAATEGSVAGASTQIKDAPTAVNGFAITVTGNAGWATYASLGLVGATAIGFIITHLELIRHGWYRSRRFMAVHPVFDVLIVVSIVFLLMYTVGGFIG